MRCESNLVNTNSILIAIIVIIMFASPGAQAENHFGVRAGVNTAMMVGDGLDEFHGESIHGHMFGVYSIFPLNNDCEFQLELLLSQRGFKRFYSMGIWGGRIDLEETIKLTYVEFPVLVKFPTPPILGAKLGFYLGPSLGWRLKASCAAEYEVIDSDALSDGTFDLDVMNAHRFDLGLVVGTDITIAVAGPKIVFDVRFTTGSRDVFLDEDLPIEIPNGSYPIVNLSTGVAPLLTTKAFSFSIGVLF